MAYKRISPIPVAEGGTGLISTIANQILYSSSTNVIAGLPTIVNGVLITNNSMVPSLLANSATPGFVLTANSGAPPSWQAPSDPAATDLFIAYASATLSNVTGDGTAYSVILNTAIQNVGSNYNTATGFFIAPATGVYQFGATVSFSGMTVADISLNTIFPTNSENYGIINLNPSTQVIGGVFVCNGSALISMTAGNFCGLTVQVSGSTKTVSITGGISNTQFTGYRVS